MLHNKTIAINVFESEKNKYIELMKKAYSNLGLNVVPLNKENLENADFININWTEFSESLLVYIKYFLKRKKIIWTLHNKMPHTQNKLSLIQLFRVKILALLCYRIIIHSEESRRLSFIPALAKKKIVYVPHPNYIGEYGEERRDILPDNKKLKLLFFGLIRGYKNLELLLEVLKELDLLNLELSIYGELIGTRYPIKIKKIVKDAGKSIQINARLSFIDDSEIPHIFAGNHILVSPYNLKSSLNSGSIICSFSYKRSVISPLNGTLKDFPNKDDFFSYEYKNEMEHKEQLKKTILFIYEKYAGKYNELLKLGENCFKQVKENNSMHQIVNSLREML